MAMALGSAPTLIGGPGFLVARLTGVTEAEAELTTRATCLRGRAAGRVPGAWVRSAGVAGRVVRAARRGCRGPRGPRGPRMACWAGVTGEVPAAVAARSRSQAAPCGNLGERVVYRRGIAVVAGQRAEAERCLDGPEQAVVGVADARDVSLADSGGAEQQGRHPLGGMLVVVAILVERDDRQRPLGAPRRRAHDGTKFPGQEAITGADPAAFHVAAVVRADPGEARRGGGAGQVALQ